MQLTPENWKRFVVWRERELHAIYQSDEYKALMETIIEVETMMYAPITFKRKFLFWTYTAVNAPGPESRWEMQQDVKVLQSRRRALLDRVPARCIEGFFDWAVLELSKDMD